MNVSDNPLGDSGALIIANALKKSLHLVKLNMASTNMTTKGAHYIFEGLLMNQSVIDIDISSIPGGGRNRNLIMGCEPVA